MYHEAKLNEDKKENIVVGFFLMKKQTNRFSKKYNTIKNFSN